LALRALVRQCDGLVIAAPEYAHGVPGALKNALDWLVASDAIPGKPIALFNAAPRAFHAQAALRETLATMAARLAPEAFVTLPLSPLPEGWVGEDERFTLFGEEAAILHERLRLLSSPAGYRTPLDR